jgi:hypothetical protein
LDLSGSVTAAYGEVRNETSARYNTTRVIPGNPAASLLLTKAADVHPDGHAGGRPWPVGSASYNTVQTWIQQGAVNNLMPAHEVRR